MKRFVLTSFVFYLLSLASCSTLPSETPSKVSIESVVQMSTPDWTPLPTVSPTVTQLPTEILNDILVANYGDLKIEQGQGIVQKPGHKLSSIDTEITSDCKHTGQYGIRIRYAMQNEYASERSDFGIWAIGVDQSIRQFPLIDIKDFKAIEFWVKGAIGGEIFEIWIANEFDAEIGLKSTSYVNVSSKEWRMIRIPFSDFYRDRAFHLIPGVSFYFFSTSGTGEICIDDINFTN